MEPAAGFLSPRPFPRADAPPAPPAGPGPPPSAMPGPELEMLAAPPAPDSGRLITDPCSGRTYFKGRLLGKVSWGVVLARVERGPACLYQRQAGWERLSSARGHLRVRSGLRWNVLPDAPSS